MDVTESPKKTEPTGSAASFTTTPNAPTNDSTSLPLSGRAPLAGESSDPAVQKLLADRQAHQMNRDLIDPPVVDPKALQVLDDQLAEVDDKLADLGFPQESQEDRKAALQKAADDAAAKDKELAEKAAKRVADREAADAKK